MASYFGEVLPPRSRFLDDEDLDAIEEGFCEEFNISCQQEQKEKNLLIVSDGSLPSAYAKLNVQEAQACGEILAKSFNKDICIGKIFRGSDWTVLTCEQDLKHQEFLNLANKILSIVDDGCQIVCLTARHISEYRVEEQNIEDSSIVRYLSSKSFKHSNIVSRLEVPNILTGLSAAILSISIVKGFGCYLLVNYVDMLTPDSISLQAFNNIHKLQQLQASSLQKPNIAEALKNKRLNNLPNNLYL